MRLIAGTELGPYSIVSPLGAGGMGEVYRARDMRLGREVALKLLPDEFAADPLRRQRFEEEAKSLAALNHPNILVVFDVSRTGDIVFMVSELLEGQTLRKCLDEETFSVRRALHYALDIAQGLAAAHLAGYVHRDLKPENIFITRDDRVKILDFGLAKHLVSRTDSVGAVAPDSQTISKVIMGSPGYSAPEQISGKQIDHRADFFSFGAILYEMLSGRRAFPGVNGIEVMNASVRVDPPQFPATLIGVSPGLERITRRCLEKKPEERFQCARDIAFALEAISQTPSSQDAASRTGKERNSALLLGLLAATTLACAGMAFLLFRPTRQVPSFRQLIFGRGYISSARFTPDGHGVIFGGAFFGRPRELLSTRLDGKAWRSLDLPPADILGMAKSGDMAILLGRHNFYQWMTVGLLGVVPLSGGAPHRILDDICDGDIGPDGQAFAIVRCVKNTETLEYPIGNILFRTNGWISNPRISPRADAVAFLEHPLLGDDRGYVSLVNTSGGSKRLTKEWSGESGCAWAPSGKEIWFASSDETERQSLRAVSTSGTVRVVLATVTDVGLQDVGADGRVLLTDIHSSTEMLIGHKGWSSDRMLQIPQEHARIAGISDDGHVIALGSSGAGSGHDYSTLVLTEGAAEPVRLGDGDPSSISPDGKWILSLTPSQLSKLVLYPTGTGQPKTLDIGPVQILGVTSTWTSDGAKVLFTGADKNQPPRTYLLDIKSGLSRAVTPEDTVDGIISPDGKYAVARDSSRKFVIFSVGSEEAKPAPGLDTDDVPIQWDASSRKLYVWNRSVPATIHIVDTRTGARTLWLRVASPEGSGLLYGEIYVTPDGHSYGYRYRRILTDLFLAENLQ